jgi:hypothetical protein
VTQVQAVLQAYLDGSRTTSEVSSLTGLPLKHACAITRLLESRGLIERKGLAARTHATGAAPIFFQPKGENCV